MQQRAWPCKRRHSKRILQAQMHCSCASNALYGIRRSHVSQIVYGSCKASAECQSEEKDLEAACPGRFKCTLLKRPGPGKYLELAAESLKHLLHDPSSRKPLHFQQVLWYR